MLKINAKISIPDDELHEEFLRGTGAGGQHVNKTETTVRLRFDAQSSPSLTAPVRDRLLKLAGAHATSHGEILIEAREHRSQKMNREAARERLVDLIKRAARAPKRRAKTKPTRAAKERRIKSKKAHSSIKKMRRAPSRDE